MNKLVVGATRRCINVPKELQPYPSYYPDQYYAGSYTDCNMRAIVIDNGITRSAILGYDMNAIPADADFLKIEISERFNIPAGNILFSATHNPTSYDMVGTMDPVNRSKVAKYQMFVCRTTLDAVAEAIENMKPAHYAYGEGKSYINDNSNSDYTGMHINSEIFNDKTLSVIKFVDESNKLIAAVVNYNMHVTLGYYEVDSDGKTRASGNIPGEAACYAESHYGNDAVILWTSSAAGSQNPYTLEGGSAPNATRLKPGVQYQAITIFGKIHGVDICNTIDSISKYNQNMPIRFTGCMIEVPGASIGEAVNNQIPLYIQEACLGDMAIISLSADLYGAIGKACKEVSPYKKTMIVTHVNNPSTYSHTENILEDLVTTDISEYDDIIVENVRTMFDKMYS